MFHTSPKLPDSPAQLVDVQSYLNGGSMVVHSGLDEECYKAIDTYFNETRSEMSSEERTETQAGIISGQRSLKATVEDVEEEEEDDYHIV